MCSSTLRNSVPTSEPPIENGTRKRSATKSQISYCQRLLSLFLQFAGTDAGAGTKQPGAVRTRGVSPVGACLFLIWAAAALILLLRKILSYQSYLHFVRTGNREVTDPEVRRSD